MPKKSFDGLPYPPLVTLDRDDPIRPDDLAPLLRRRPRGVTLCIRSGAVEGAKQNRGGYFFHITPNPNNPGHYFLTDFEKIPIARSGHEVIQFDIDDLCEFVNHCTGMRFSESCLLLCQMEINFRSDPDEADED